MSRLTSTGVALSAGALEPKEDWLPAASRMPVALGARVTRKLPTAVFWAPAPSARTRVALAPAVETEAREPPLGTLASVQGAVSEEAASVSERVALTRSTLPLPSTSRITGVPATSTGFAPSAGGEAAKEER